MSIRVLGVEDGSFIPRVSRRCLLAGVLMDGLRIVDVLLRVITVDGLDVTDAVISMTRASGRLDAIFCGGITFAGFNVLDPARVHEETGIPLIIVAKRKPDSDAMLRALRKHFPDWEVRWRMIQRAGRTLETLNWKDGSTIYFESVGMPPERARELISALTIWGKRPEPLRAAKIIARGLSRLLTDEPVRAEVE